MLEKDFYTKVEEPGYLQRMLYGDSVAEYTNTIIHPLNEGYVELTFEELWKNLVELGCKITIENDKEYIYLTNEFQTISYDILKRKVIFDTPKYIVRHYINDELIRLFYQDKYIDVTKKHSMIDYPTYKKIDPCNLDRTPIFDYMKMKFFSTSIMGNETIWYNGYVYDLCIPETQNFVANGILVHNTDSIFYVIPTNNPDQKTPEELWDVAIETSESINDLIIDYTKNTLLPRCNIDPEENQTFFKTELLMSSLMLLDVKKNYAFKLLVKEGNVLKEPEVSYTGIQVIRSDTAKFTQDLLKEMIENIILNEEIENQHKKDQIVQVIDNYRSYIKNLINDFEFSDIGIPKKWAKDKLSINGMKLYNKIMNEEIFTPMSAGKFIYCKFGKDFGKDINGICVPYSYNKEILKEKFELNKIIIDENKQWETLLTTTCKRVIDLVHKLKKGEN